MKNLPEVPTIQSTLAPPTYSTGDIDLIAFLLAKQHKPSKAERLPNSDSILVHFENKTECEKLAKKFYSGATVVAILYAKSIQQAKDIIFTEKRRAG